MGIFRGGVGGGVYRLVEGEKLLGLKSSRNRNLKPGAKVLGQDFLAFFFGLLTFF